tara:strand:- start:1907 stop:2479 length:573 start_codon:yes stop_codon:yes gene_type:complete
MSISASGAVSLNTIHTEAGGSSGTTCSLGDSDIRAIIGNSSGANNMNAYRGHDNQLSLSCGQDTITLSKVDYYYNGVASVPNGISMGSWTDASTNAGGTTRSINSLYTSVSGNTPEMIIPGNTSSTSFSNLFGYSKIKSGSNVYFDSSLTVNISYNSTNNTTSYSNNVTSENTALATFPASGSVTVTFSN